jgi:hypothetical protein
MEYQAIREARLRVPFRPFTLTFSNGWTVLVDEPTHLAIAPNVLLVADEKELPRHFHPRDVTSLVYADETSGKAN